MCNKLELVRESKLYRLIPGKKKNARLEASGVALVDPHWRACSLVCKTKWYCI